MKVCGFDWNRDTKDHSGFEAATSSHTFRCFAEDRPSAAAALGGESAAIRVLGIEACLAWNDVWHGSMSDMEPCLV
jgi:hypothetical protein